MPYVYEEGMRTRECYHLNLSPFINVFLSRSLSGDRKYGVGGRKKKERICFCALVKREIEQEEEEKDDVDVEEEVGVDVFCSSRRLLSQLLSRSRR